MSSNKNKTHAPTHVSPSPVRPCSSPTISIILKSPVQNSLHLRSRRDASQKPKPTRVFRKGVASVEQMLTMVGTGSKVTFQTRWFRIKRAREPRSREDRFGDLDVGERSLSPQPRHGRRTSRESAEKSPISIATLEREFTGRARRRALEQTRFVCGLRFVIHSVFRVLRPVSVTTCLWLPRSPPMPFDI